jgi:hypothetical protein
MEKSEKPSFYSSIRWRILLSIQIFSGARPVWRKKLFLVLDDRKISKIPKIQISWLGDRNEVNF